jgi:Spo12 family
MTGFAVILLNASGRLDFPLKNMLSSNSASKEEEPKPSKKIETLKFHSPTDNFFSPISKKIEAKRNHLLKS